MTKKRVVGLLILQFNCKFVLQIFIIHLSTTIKDIHLCKTQLNQFYREISAKGNS